MLCLSFAFFQLNLQYSLSSKTKTEKNAYDVEVLSQRTAEINICIKYKLWNLHHSILDLCLHKDKIQLQRLTGVDEPIWEEGTRSSRPWLMNSECHVKPSKLQTGRYSGFELRVGLFSVFFSVLLLWMQRTELRTWNWTFYRPLWQKYSSENIKKRSLLK